MSAVELLLCPPTYFAVEYVINPWMVGNLGRVDRERAQRQWDALHAALAQRAQVTLIEPARGLPDMVFTANAGLVEGNYFAPARFRFVERRGEQPLYRAWFREQGYREPPAGTRLPFEGEGDLLRQPGMPFVWAGFGFRSSLLAHADLQRWMPLTVVALRLVDPRFYHLDTCLLPLPEGRLVYFPPAFAADSLHMIRALVPPEDRYEVGPEDAEGLACNAVVVDDAVITGCASPSLQGQLRRWQLEPLVRPLDEFLRAGGGAKCLSLYLRSPATSVAGDGSVDDDGVLMAEPAPAAGGIADTHLEIGGHLLDRGLLARALDVIAEQGGAFEIDQTQIAEARDQLSQATLRVAAPSDDTLQRIVGQLVSLGVDVRKAGAETDATLRRVLRDGVAPDDFYCTNIYPTEVRVRGRWRRVAGQRMDAVVVMTEAAAAGNGRHDLRCKLLRNLSAGDLVVCGGLGVRTLPVAQHRDDPGGSFSFMSAIGSSERRVERVVTELAYELRHVHARGGRTVVVAGPVVIHAGGAPYLATLLRRGLVQALLSGNALAVHDVERALYGTSLGLDLHSGARQEGGHTHHLRAINLVRKHGSLRAAVTAGAVASGIMYECIEHQVPFALAGSIRDDGPLPDTQMDLVAAQNEYARLLAGADLVLILGSMLHGIGVGNMTPAGTKLVCVDINPAVVTKLADRGSLESVGVVTDVGLFLKLLAEQIESAGERDGSGQVGATTAPAAQARNRSLVRSIPGIRSIPGNGGSD